MADALMGNNGHIGMSDEKLEATCRITGGFHSFNWTAEVYSFGKCYRELANYPKLLPLFFYSDHGAGLHSNLYPHEIQNKSSLHLTWHPLKASRHNEFTKTRFVQIPHPWVLYRKRKGYARPKKHQGTLVFFTHHVPGVKWQGHDSEEYLRSLKNLPEKFQPIVICMHMHDIHAGHHKKLRDWGFPIVTAGNIYNDNFVDNFYNLISPFSYGTSPEWGSQTAYMVEFGIPYFFHGNSPTLINIEHKEMPEGIVSRFQDEEHKSYVQRAEELFKHPLDNVSPIQKEFVDEILGLNSNITEAEIKTIIWKEFFKNWIHWHQIFTRIIFNVLATLGVIKLLKSIYNFLTHKNSE